MQPIAPNNPAEGSGIAVIVDPAAPKASIVKFKPSCATVPLMVI